MMCPGCIGGPLIGSALGFVVKVVVERLPIQDETRKKVFGFLARFSLPKETPLKVKIISNLAAAALTLATTLSVKYGFHISFCGTRFSILRFSAVILAASIVWMVYSMAINYFINYIQKQNQQKSCCCNNDQNSHSLDLNKV